jgi:hypothetical protein
MSVIIRDNLERDLTAYVNDFNQKQMEALDRSKRALPNLMNSVPSDDPLWGLFRKNKWREMVTYVFRNRSQYPWQLIHAAMGIDSDPIDGDFVNTALSKMKVNFPIVQKAVSAAASAADVDVIIAPEVSLQKMEWDEDSYPISTFTLTVNGIHVSLFVENGKLLVDDIPEDFEDVRSTPESFWGLQKFIKEMQSPGSTKSSKKLVLYTARPAKDRARYVNAKTVPPGIFLTNSEDHAQGLAEEYGARELYKVVIEEKYLLKTLDGRIKYYQVMGDSPAPAVISYLADMR